MTILAHVKLLQLTSGTDNCCFCLRPLRRTGKRKSLACWSVDCRQELDRVRYRQRKLAALSKAVKALGRSAKALGARV